MCHGVTSSTLRLLAMAMLLHAQSIHTALMMLAAVHLARCNARTTRLMLPPNSFAGSPIPTLDIQCQVADLVPVARRQWAVGGGKTAGVIWSRPLKIKNGTVL